MENLLKENKSLVEKFKTIRTPFYYYDTELLDQTLQAIKNETDKLQKLTDKYIEQINKIYDEKEKEIMD